MPQKASASGSELFIVDNSNADWQVRRYLHDWCQIAKQFDIATGYFEIGAFLCLNQEWQKLDKIRILMGDEVSLRTKQAFVDGLACILKHLDDSLENEKPQNDFLEGVPAIVAAIRSGKVECRVYRKEKFHAKAYITHAKLEVVGAAALVGSSNFTHPGLNRNIELNVQITGSLVAVLQEWYEEHWQQAEEVTPEILRTLERHVRDYPPFDIYVKALYQLFTRHELTANEWEQKHSVMRLVLDQYQVDGYRALIGIAKQHGGALLCDGVGLGKTFVGLMLIERLVMFEKKRVVLLVPKSGRESVWERNIRRYLPHLLNGFLSFKVYNHTDLMRGVSADGRNFPEEFAQLKNQADVIIVDEAHHFRNRGLRPESGGSRYWNLYDLCENKQVFLLTATPVNNHLTDFQHLIELFSRVDRPAAFAGAPLGIHSLPGHFKALEKQLATIVSGAGWGELFDANQVEAEQILFNDRLFRELVVQRSRSFVKQSQLQQGAKEAQFPIKEDPRVAAYSVRKTYGHILKRVEIAFAKEKPLFALAPYYPLAYFKGDPSLIKDFEAGRQRGLVRLIRIQFLKRFESSITAFEQSCQNLMLKMLAFIKVNSATANEHSQFEKWQKRHEELLTHIRDRRQELNDDDDAEENDDELADEFASHFTPLARDNFKMDEIFADTYGDLDTLVQFMEELKQFTPDQDDKLKALVKLLKTDPALKGRKVLIFSEFMSTARYVKRELIKQGLDGVDEIDSASKRDRAEALQQFSPYYNGITSADLAAKGLKETRILIATDVLSEGLNLQDATRLINYDLHWNPVRLMQRIGRVDRRLNPELEAKLIEDHPKEGVHRGKVIYWNFLPPDELEDLLRLFGKVAKKTLRISKVFGIEGRKLLRPEDEFDALKDFLSTYEGSTTQTERMQLELERLLAADPSLAARIEALPGSVFSGKKHPKPGTQAVFFCYSLPGEDRETKVWSESAGRSAWYLYAVADGRVTDQPEEIHASIQCEPDTLRHCELASPTLREIRLKIEKHIRNTYLKQVQAPVGVKPILKCWMVLN
jgi:superfamily II DNA or RNA helicase